MRLAVAYGRRMVRAADATIRTGYEGVPPALRASQFLTTDAELSR